MEIISTTAVKLGSSKLPPIDPFHDIDPMLGNESESSNHHLLALCDVTVKEFELLCGKKPGPENDDAVTDDKTDSEWEEAELQDFMPRLYFFWYLQTSAWQKKKKGKNKIVAIRESFSLTNEVFFDFHKSFLREIRHTNYYSQKFLSKISWFYDLAKVPARESFCP